MGPGVLLMRWWDVRDGMPENKVRMILKLDLN